MRTLAPLPPCLALPCLPSSSIDACVFCGVGNAVSPVSAQAGSPAALRCDHAARGPSKPTKSSQDPITSYWFKERSAVTLSPPKSTALAADAADAASGWPPVPRPSSCLASLVIAVRPPQKQPLVLLYFQTLSFCKKRRTDEIQDLDFGFLVTTEKKKDIVKVL